jgi:4-hydroxy-tetrahydrodipicolinate synthase
MIEFGKLITAAITPFDKNGVINTDTLWRLCRKLIHDKSESLVLTGTTAESPNLTKEDREIIYSTANDSVGDKAKLIAGTGTYSTKESIEYTKLAEDLGMDGIMIVTPYYSKPSQYGILKHFEAISNETNLPIMAYNIPGRTGTLIEIETIEKLVNEINIHSIKDAVGDIEFSKKQIDLVGDKVQIYSGDDALTYDFVINGAVGVVSVASHVVGCEIAKMIELIQSGMTSEAKDLNLLLQDIFTLIFEEPSPGPIKSLLSETWESVGDPLLPITPISEDLTLKLLDNFKKIQ